MVTFLDRLTRNKANQLAPVDPRGIEPRRYKCQGCTRHLAGPTV